MSNISFFTPIQFEGPKTFKQHIQEGVENYFYLGGKSAYVIPGKIIGNCQRVAIRDIDQNKIKQVIIGVIKIISYMTVIIPLVMLAAKAAFRSSYTFHAGLRTSPALAQTTNGSTVSDLMDRFTNAWNDITKSFNFAPDSFDLESFYNLLVCHEAQFKKEGVTNELHFGYIEKIDLNHSETPQIFMRADLHGDLKSLLENIRSLKEQGLLDQNFKCKTGVHLVFLGDYCDRGAYGTQILEMLMRLREENPGQVHLIRGNHEYCVINQNSAGLDNNLRQITNDIKAWNALDRFYETMSLTTYFSVDQEQREYVQCTHGLFEPTMDPAPLLDNVSSNYLPVSKTRELSDRIRKIADGNKELTEAAKRIKSLVEESRFIGDNITAYNWADVTMHQTTTGRLGRREYALSARDIRHYLDLSSEHHRVMMIFRGHEHEFQHLMYEEKVLVTTLPVGMDSHRCYQSFTQPDRAYIIKLSHKVENWKKRAILREKGQAVTHEITGEFPLTSSAI